jgi:hypothetical protein
LFGVLLLSEIVYAVSKPELSSASDFNNSMPLSEEFTVLKECGIDLFSLGNHEMLVRLSAIGIIKFWRLLFDIITIFLTVKMVFQLE